MNEHDSSRMGESLARAGWSPVETPEQADLVLLNTCAIREKAEDKLFSALGRYRMLKAQRGLKIGISGCVAQQEKDKLVARAPFVDFVLGPDQLSKVAELAALPSAGKGQGRVETGWVPSEEYLFPQADPETSRGAATAFVTVMKGCDNVCSFCVVPYTRGREVSRPYAEVVREIASLCAVGVREVTLIGQNVNSYAGGCSFAALVRRVSEVPGLARIRFTTSHPMDLSEELVACFAPPEKAGEGGVPNLMPHFHLPVQHGSDPVLARMRRSYKVAEYERRVQGLLALCPGLSLTSDIICGFPGETEQDHQETLALLRRVPYDNLFSFLYSRRPHTTAEKMLERNEAAAAPAPEWAEVPRELALARLEEVQTLQMARTLERRRARVGSEVEVLVESARFSDSGEPLRFGRSRDNWTVHFKGDAKVGDLVRVRVDRATVGSVSGVQTSIVDAAAVPVPPQAAPVQESAPKRKLAVLQA
jgi:tRNA-2-methylthio-N6-dimethylallyladenosine synthase